MKSILTYLLLLLSLHTTAQQLVVDSTRFITGYRAGTAIEYSIPTADKGILFVGFEGYGNAGGIIPPFPLDTTYTNVFIGKIDSNHQISWLKVYGGSNYDAAISACQTPDGGFAVLATTQSDDGNVTEAIGFEVGNLWLLRLDAEGSLLWQKCFGSTTGGSSAMSIANTPDHGFILLGGTDGSDADVPFHYGDFFSYDWLVVKTDSLGNKQWSKDLGTTGDESYYGSILSVDSAYYLVSSTDSNNHDCTDTFWHPGVYTGDDIYVLKLDTAGNVLWDSSYGGSHGDGALNAMYDTRDSTIMATGFSYSDDYMVTGNHGGGDMWVLKLNRDGTLIWQKTLGDTAQDGSTGICAAYNGGYIVYGSTFEGPIGQQDCWLFNIDSAGDEVTNKIFGGTDYDDPTTSVFPYSNGYVATGFSSSMAFTEGTNYGAFSTGGGAFISYIDYWPLSVSAVGNNNEQLFVYPDPAQNEVIIKAVSAGKLTIVDMTGRQVYYNDMQSSLITAVNVSGWAKGMYIVRWQGEDGRTITQKLVIN